MPKETLTQAAFVPSDPNCHLLETFYALNFPVRWREVMLDLYRYSKPNPDRLKYVPIRRLNSALAGLAPDLISVARNATVDDDSPWLYTTSTYQLSTINSFVLAWLRHLQPSPDAFPAIMTAAKQLETESLEWNLLSVDLLARKNSPGGTALPDDRLFQLLPDVIAKRIATYCEDHPYEHNGQRVRFYTVASNHGAELMSWPPLDYTPRGDKAKLWSYSGTIRVSLQTVPFSLVPRIHVHTGIRRWVRGKVKRAGGYNATAYLRSDSPWLDPGQQTHRFTKAKFGWSRAESRVIWKDLHPDLIKQLSANASYPQPHLLEDTPDTWLDARTGVQGGVAFHTSMGYHGVAPGLLPQERNRLTAWVAQAVAPTFRIQDDLVRVTGRAVPKPALRDRMAIPTLNPIPEKVAAADAANVAIDAANALQNRQLVAEVCGGKLDCHIFFQTKDCRDEIIRAAEEHLGLTAYKTDALEGTWQWNSPELMVRIHAVAFDLGGPLGDIKPPRTAEQVRLATGARRDAVKTFTGQLEEASRLVFVELDHKDDFPLRTEDPKFAIRLGCADAGRVSQFIVTFRNTDESEETGEADDRAYRADAAWRDGLRQLGARFVPTHTLGDSIPKDLNQIAFWMIKKSNTKGKLGSQFTPIAVLIRPNQKTIMGRTPDSDTWMPYPELLLRLVGRVHHEDSRTAERQETEAALFVRKVLYGLRHEQNLVVVHAQNARSRMSFLTNGGLTRDMFRLGDGPVQRLALHGAKTRLLRVRSSDRDETAQWWALGNDGVAGYSKGLWKPSGADSGNRVFYSTTSRSSKIQTPLETSKLTTHVTSKVLKDKVTGEKEPITRQSIQPKAAAWNPALLELTVSGLPQDESPELWALFLHQQRQVDEHRDGLSLPLALYLAERASQYALPHEYEVEQADDAKAAQGSLSDESDEGDYRP